MPASLQIGDAMKYMDRVRDTFIDRPEVYMQFLDVMKEFQSDRYAPPSFLLEADVEGLSRRRESLCRVRALSLPLESSPLTPPPPSHTAASTRPA